MKDRSERDLPAALRRLHDKQDIPGRPKPKRRSALGRIWDRVRRLWR
jgi:hypothetical protein